MATYNPDFWEVPLSNTAWFTQLSNEKALWFESEEDRERRWAREELILTLMSEVKKSLERLTPAQHRIFCLYWFERRTQKEIAALVGVNQSTVSRHLFGTVRNNKRVGGAANKLRKILQDNAAANKAWKLWETQRAA